MTFGEYLEKVREYRTPAAPKSTIIRPVKGDPLISLKMQELYRSGVGMLLWLVKHSRPEMSNPTRELSKVGDGATEGHWKCLMRAIRFVLTTKDFALKKSQKRMENFLQFKVFQIVVLQKIKKQEQVSMDILSISVEHQWLGSQKVEKVLLCHQQRQNIMLFPRWLRKFYLLGRFWKTLGSRLSTQLKSRWIMLEQCFYATIFPSAKEQNILIQDIILLENLLRMKFSKFFLFQLQKMMLICALRI